MGDDVADRLARLRQDGGRADLCLAVRDLVVVCSSSRGGSSLFGELLRRSPDLLTFSAEINPHVTIPSLGSGGGCDVVGDPAPFAAGQGLDVLRGELGNDLGRRADVLDRTEFARHVAWRLTMQWPNEPIDPSVVAGWVDEVLSELGTHPARPDRQSFLLALLRRMRTTHPTVDPYRYDIDPAVVAQQFPEATAPSGPTAEPVIEMAPFVLPRAWQPATAADAARMPVVATTPRNAFRLPLLAAAFPNARVRVIHLTRNPAASTNGLRDGWLHHGFFSCRTEEPLAIAGYSDCFPGWGTQWWNYDVPPGWRSWTNRPLTDVCGFQWRAAHEATIDNAAAANADVLRVQFEDIVGEPDRRRRAIERLCAWLDVDPRPVVEVDRLPVVMPTEAPRRRRWLNNAQVLEPVLTDPQILATARELGYPRDPQQWE